jgi:hypothetical protein
MNKKTFFYILYLLVFVGCACAILYPHTSFSSSSAEIKYTALSDSLTIEEEDIIVIHHQMLKGYSGYMRVLHDNKRNVTCWEQRGGLACIPDYLLEGSQNART